MKIADVISSLKKKTLDKTDLDERTVSAVRSGAQAVRQTASNAFNSGVSRVKQTATNWYQNTDLNRSMPGVQSPKAGVEITKQNLSRSFVLSPSTLKSAAQYGETITPRINSPILRAATAAGTKLVKDRYQGFTNTFEGLKNNDKPRAFVGAFQSIQPSIAMGVAGPKQTLGSGLISSGISAGIAKLTGKDPAEAAGKGFVEGINTASVTGFTNPITNKVVGAVAPKASMLVKQVAQRTVGGLANVGEDEIIAKFNEYKTTAPDKALSFIIGAGVTGNSELFSHVSKAVKNFFNRGDLSPEQKKQAVKIVDAYIRDAKGRFANTPKLPVLKSGASNAQITPKYTPKYVQMVGGSVMDFNAKPEWVETPTGIKRANVIRSKSRLVGNQTAQTMMGAGLGVQAEQDKDGKIKVTYDPKMGVIGMGIMAGQKATGFKNAKNTFSNLTDKKVRFEIDDSQAKIKQSVIDNFKQKYPIRIINAGDVLEHNELFKNYPGAKDIQIKFLPASGKPNAFYSPKNNTITINSDTRNFAGWRNEIKSTLLHEVQHAIQSIEGFAKGGNPEMFKFREVELSNQIENINKQLVETVRQKDFVKNNYGPQDEIVRLDNRYKQLMSDKLKLVDELTKSQDEYGLSGVGSYKRLAGEVEARDVQSRMDLTPKERTSTQPLVSQNVPLKDQIVRFDDGVSNQVNFKNENEGFRDATFNAPYKRGDIKVIQDELDKALGTDSFILGKDDYKSRFAARQTAFAQLEDMANRGDKDAEKYLRRARELENQLINAQQAKNNPSQVPDKKAADIINKSSELETLKQEAKDRFKIDVDNVGKANNQIDQWVRYLNDKPDEALKAAGYSQRGGGNADYVSQGLIELKKQLNQAIRVPEPKPIAKSDSEVADNFKKISDVLPKLPVQTTQPFTVKQTSETASPEALARLDHLLNDTDWLVKQLGYSPKEAEKISILNARYILENKIKPEDWFSESFPAQMARAHAPEVDGVITTPEGKNIANLTPQDRNTAENLYYQNSGKLDGNPIKQFIRKFNDLLYPIKNVSADIQTATRSWDTAIKTSRVDANNLNLQFRDLVKKVGLTPAEEWKLVQYSEQPSSLVARDLGIDAKLLQKAQPLLDLHRKINDKIYQESFDSGVDIKYLNNHVYHAWKESAQQVDEAITKAKGLSGKPGFAKHRGIQTYQEGVENFGLTPRFTTFGQANAVMLQALEKAKANKAFADRLINSGQLVADSQKPSGWVEITAPFFRKATVETADGLRQENYAAPPELASFINNLLGGQQKTVAGTVLEKFGDASAWLQDIKLSGGIRGLNAFTLGNIIKDMTTGLGEVTTAAAQVGTLRPIKGIKTGARGIRVATAGVGPLLRTFIPYASDAFEKQNSATIREMARNGITYSGKNSFEEISSAVPVRKATISSTAGKVKDAAAGVWNWLFNAPTFKEMMWQRKVNLYKAMKDSLSGEMSPDEAGQMAAKMLASYDGISDDIGRNQDVSNILKTVLFAPRYREAVIGSLGNAAVATLNPKQLLKTINPFDSKSSNQEISRSLGLGMLLSYFLIYDTLNQKYNEGRHLWENPPGKEFELVIPKRLFGKEVKSGDYYSVPFMPGFTATPRRIAGGVSALASGDFREAGKQFGSLLSTPIQSGVELVTGKDYFGRDLYDNTKPMPQQIAKQAFRGLAPGWIREYTRYAEDKANGKNPSKALAVARAFELPIKEGNIDTSWYYAFQDNVTKGLSTPQQEIFKQVYGDKRMEPTNTVEKKQRSMLEAQLLLMNPEVLEARKLQQMLVAEKTGRPIDPFYMLNNEQQKVVLNMNAQAPGSEISDQLTKQNIDWLKPFWKANEEYYDKLGEAGVFADKPELPGPTLKRSDEVMALQDTYFNLPKGTGERTAFLNANPELKQYWDDKADYENQLRVSMGLPAIEKQSWGSYTPKLSIGKPKKISIKKIKFKKPKITKLKFNIPKAATNQIKIKKAKVLKIKLKR